MSDIDTNDPTSDAVSADPASVDDGVPTDDNVLDAPESATDAAVVEPSDEETAASDEAVSAEAESPDADVSTDEPGVDSAEGGEASPEAVDVEELLEPAVVDNPYTRPGRWFVVHTQSGYEKKVKQNLEARIHSMNAEEAVYEVVIPMEDYVDFKNGKRVVNQRKMFPG